MAKKAAPRKKAKAVKAPAKPKSKKAAGGKAVLPVKQRLRFFYKNEQVALFEYNGSSNNLLKIVPILNGNSVKTYAKIWHNSNTNELMLDSDPKGPLDKLKEFFVDFDGDECSMWNEYNGTNHQIVIGTGDIRNIKPNELDLHLWTWTVPKEKDGAIWLYFENVNYIKVLSKDTPA